MRQGEVVACGWRQVVRLVAGERGLQGALAPGDQILLARRKELVQGREELEQSGRQIAARIESGGRGIETEAGEVGGGRG